jgi:hypothetical protein
MKQQSPETICPLAQTGRRSTPQAVAAELGVQERVFLFCLESGTDWERAGLTHATAQQMLVRGLDRSRVVAKV